MRSLVFLMAGMFLVGCESNPYPEGSIGSGDYRREAQKPTREVKPPISASIPQSIEYKEGYRKVTSFRVSVPPPGVPVMQMENLPAGATFDPKTGSIAWKPGFFDGNNPEDPSIKTRTYSAKFFLRSSLDLEGKDAIKEEVLLIVHDVPQKLEIDGDDMETVDEGRTMEYYFSVDNPDYPNGPFAVTTKGMPANSKIVQVNDKMFKLVFSPDFHHVKLNQNPNPCSSWDRNCTKYEGEITVINPAGHQAMKEVEIQVEDVRQEVNLVTPSDMKQGLDITFHVSGYDPNGEVAPDIKFAGKEPAYGTWSTSLEKDHENNSSVLSVSWKDIPPSYNGKFHTFDFKSCVLDDAYDMDSCDNSSFSVQIEVKDRKAPIIDRSNWAAGDIKYLNLRESDWEYIYIKDGDNFNQITKVEIKPEAMKKYVSFNGTRLSVRFDKPGIHQFSIVATSEYNVASAESFVAEVFHEDRSRTLYFTDSTRDAEATFYTKTMGNVQMLNPVLQPLNDRNISGRDTLILGTGILTDKNMKGNIERAMQKIRNVVIASPLIQNMPEKFLKELASLEVTVLGRYSELPNTPDINLPKFVMRPDFQKPQSPVGLKLNSTPESHDPIAFGLSVKTTKCDDVLDYTYQAPGSDNKQIFKMGLICQRPGGGRYAIFGTEFSDLKVSESDAQIPSNWFRKMLSASLNAKSQEVK